jgi:Cys-tRNA(Pro)/Cys-tRNA(Cys) deacylase
MRLCGILFQEVRDALKIMYDWGNRSLPVTARLRVEILHQHWWPAGHATPVKTNAVRLLDRLGVHYELREYDVDPEDLSAETVARKVGMPPEQVFKTLVARGDRNGVCLAGSPGNSELDPKALAHLTGDRRIEMVPLKEVQPLTGYIRGGVTALACKKDYPVFADETIELFDSISISAGARGIQILIAPPDYVRITGARLGPIARDKP